MDCPDCEEPLLVTFSVPEELREFAPDGAAVAVICSACLRTYAASEADAGAASEVDAGAASEVDADAASEVDAGAASEVDADAASEVDADAASENEQGFDRIADGFPTGDAGAAVALALGKLGSLALNRSAIVALLEYAETEGTDVFLLLDRLAREKQGAHFDADRRAEQVRELI